MLFNAEDNRGVDIEQGVIVGVLPEVVTDIEELNDEDRSAEQHRLQDNNELEPTSDRFVVPVEVADVFNGLPFPQQEVIRVNQAHAPLIHQTQVLSNYLRAVEDNEVALQEVPGVDMRDEGRTHRELAYFSLPLFNEQPLK